MKFDRIHCPLELKFTSNDTDTKVGTVSGYGSVFNNIDSYGDTIERGAFKASLESWKTRGSMPKMLLQHGGFSAEDGIPIGKWTSMEEDEKGLKVTGELFALDTQKGRYIHEGLKSGALDGLSIGFIAREATRGTGDVDRILKKIDLMEVSIVTFPANGAATVSSIKSADLTERDFERMLTRDAGFTRSEAITIINDGFKALKSTRDAGPDVESLQRILRAIQA